MNPPAPGARPTARSAASRRPLFRIVALTAAIALPIAIGEALLRASGFATPTSKFRSGEPAVQEPDPELGWRNKAGEYQLSPYSRGGRPIQMRFLSDGGRATQPKAEAEQATQRPQLVIVGGSFAQGWAISDRETLAWKLQARFPEIEVSNYGTGGYGSYQSLLVLERQLPKLREPALVLYAFTGHHDIRSVAPWHWMKLLSELSGQGYIDIPYATLDSRGELIRHPPERYHAWPGGSWLRLSEFLHARVLGLRDRLWGSRSAQARAVTERVLSSMNDVSGEHGARFAVALLSARAKKARSYEAFLRRNEVPFVDCNAFPLPREMIVAGEGHPNGVMNSRWSQCVGDFLEREFALGRRR